MDVYILLLFFIIIIIHTFITKVNNGCRYIITTQQQNILSPKLCFSFFRSALIDRGVRAEKRRGEGRRERWRTGEGGKERVGSM